MLNFNKKLTIIVMLFCLLISTFVNAEHYSTSTIKYPPWQQGKNNDSTHRGLELTVPEVDNLPDFHGNPINPQLTLYVGGNYFFAMAPLVAAFEKKYPEYKGKIYWETLPPGLLMKQIKNGGTVTVGNMTWTVPADVYLAGYAKVKQYINNGELVAPAVPYVTNTLTIMVPKGNPAHIKGLKDLGEPHILLAMPNPEWEGVARQIKNALIKAGGESLVTQVYTNKVKDNSTMLTHIHHRQTPLWLMQNKVQAGVTWLSEAMFQKAIGNPIDYVVIPDHENDTAIYAGALVKNSKNEKAARLWLAFLRSDESIKIFESFGFKAYQAPQ